MFVIDFILPCRGGKRTTNNLEQAIYEALQEMETKESVSVVLLPLDCDFLFQLLMPPGILLSAIDVSGTPNGIIVVVALFPPFSYHHFSNKIFA